MSSTIRSERTRSAIGPRAITAPIRSAGEATFVSDAMYTTRPSRSSASSARGGWPSCDSQCAKSSSTTNAPARAAAASTSARRSGASDTPVGFWNAGCV